jgi:hypothetical protein
MAINMTAPPSHHRPRGTPHAMTTTSDDMILPTPDPLAAVISWCDTYIQALYPEHRDGGPLRVMWHETINAMDPADAVHIITVALTASPATREELAAALAALAVHTVRTEDTT